MWILFELSSYFLSCFMVSLISDLKSRFMFWISFVCAVVFIDMSLAVIVSMRNLYFIFLCKEQRMKNGYSVDINTVKIDWNAWLVNVSLISPNNFYFLSSKFMHKKSEICDARAYFEVHWMSEGAKRFIIYICNLNSTKTHNSRRWTNRIIIQSLSQGLDSSFIFYILHFVFCVLDFNRRKTCQTTDLQLKVALL